MASLPSKYIGLSHRVHSERSDQVVAVQTYVRRFDLLIADFLGQYEQTFTISFETARIVDDD